MMDKKKKFNANLYAAFLEGKTTKEENRIVLTRMTRSPKLIMELNLASAINRGKRRLGNLF
jgi:hypothetical protein